MMSPTAPRWTALPLAAVFALGLASSAQAWAPGATLDRWQAEATMQAYEDAAYPYHPCHGRASGTADQACGTLTGGPAAGLF